MCRRWKILRLGYLRQLLHRERRDPGKRIISVNLTWLPEGQPRTFLYYGVEPCPSFDMSSRRCSGQLAVEETYHLLKVTTAYAA